MSAFMLRRMFSSKASAPILGEFMGANAKYATSFTKGSLALPPARRAAVLTCMDARIDPAKALGLEEGDAHVIRNAGGRASDDAIRSLLISYKLLGTNAFFVIGHTQCGMELFTNQDMDKLFSNDLETASLEMKDLSWHAVGKAGTGNADEVRKIDFLNVKGKFDSTKGSVLSDVLKIRAHPLVPANIPIYGFVYHVETGKMVPVEGAQLEASE
jgi:carbonic anhydrase